MLRGAGALSIACALVACSSRRDPWEDSTGGTPRFDAGDPPPPIASDVDLVSSEGRLESGGIFIACRSGLVSTGDARRDVARLGLACGPVAGMRRASDAPLEGVLSLGGAALEFPLHLEKSRCYRVFVAGDTPAVEIRIDVISGHDLPIAGETVELGLGVVPANRPLCALGDDDGVIRAAMRRAPPGAEKPGPVRFAIEVWAR
ncbi:MAG: hypothetical protein U0414_28320 [Polyangiaceae bacterium]